MPKIIKTLRVENKAGFHLRVASMISQTALNAASDVLLKNASYEADCKSCLDLLALMAPQGTELTLTVDGEDAVEVADQMEQIFRTKFGEDEFAAGSAGSSSKS